MEKPRIANEEAAQAELEQAARDLLKGASTPEQQQERAVSLERIRKVDADADSTEKADKTS